MTSPLSPLGGRSRVWSRDGRPRGRDARLWVGGVAVAASLVIVTTVWGCGVSGTPRPAADTGSSTAYGKAMGLFPTFSPATPSAHASASPHRRHSSSGRSPAPVNGRSGVRGGALFGGDGPLTKLQNKLGRRLAMVRTYYLLGQPFPSSGNVRLMEQGTTLLVSLDTPTGGATYSSIASGQHDGEILAFLRAMERAAVRYHLGSIYICFQHEADILANHLGLGSPSDFVIAWDHIHSLARHAGLDWNQGGRLHWVLVLSHKSYADGRAPMFWPGRSEVDIVGADGYNKGGCDIARESGKPFHYATAPPVTPSEIFNGAIRFAHQWGNLPVFIAEWASVPYANSSIRPRFIRRMDAYVAANRDIGAALYWNSNYPPCDYMLDNYPSSLAALAATGHSAAMQGRVVRAS